MAGRGPAPKINAIRRNKQPSVAVSGKPPADPPELRDRSSYSEQTRQWWDTWCTSPQAEEFLDSDWERLQMLAPLVERYWEEPKASILAEIRLNEERLGATVADRLRLRMKVKPDGEVDTEPQERPSENVVDMELYKELSG